LGVVEGHVKLPVKVLEGCIGADQLALELGEGLALGYCFYHYYYRFNRKGAPNFLV